MSSQIPIVFADYLGTNNNYEKFKIFHNQVINMPRDNFSYINPGAIQSLCAYFLLIENEYDNVNGMTYPQIRDLIKSKIANNIFPQKYRNERLEKKFFQINDPEGDIARLWRHPAEMAFFLGILKSHKNNKKIIDYKLCKNLYNNECLFMDIMQNYWFYLNINNNEDISSKEGIRLNDNADYRITYGILTYLKSIDRAATKFELSILLGRIDNLQTEKEILDRALIVGKELPTEQNDQIFYFFKKMQWVNNDNTIIKYKSSQQPYFKFNTYFLYLQAFKLININEIDQKITLTPKSIEMLSDNEIPLELQDLDNLISKIDDDKSTEAELMNEIILQRTPQISKAIQENTILIEKLNRRAIRNTQYDCNNKRKRNKFITELAKIKANYTCEATGRKTFRMPNGQYYVEAHHIIEFSKENGPDITENILILGPEKHMLLHHACQEEKEDLYNHLKTNGKINIERFKRMHTIYNCLTAEHVEALANKKLISSIDKVELLKLIAS